MGAAAALAVALATLAVAPPPAAAEPPPFPAGALPSTDRSPAAIRGVPATTERIVRGPLDPEFGTEGVVMASPSPGVDFASGVVVEPSGSIIVAGGAGGNGGRFGLARFTADGVLDPTFGAAGTVQTNFSPAADYADDVVRADDGSLVVVGSTRLNRGDGDMAVARYTPDGTLDRGFGGDGKVTIDFGGRFDQGLAVDVQPDGRVVVAGLADDGVIGLARLKADGAPDRSFSGDGRKTTNLPGFFDVAADLEIDATGRIVVVGETVTIHPRSGAPKENAVAVRYTATGAVDRSFGAQGVFVDDDPFRRLEFATSVEIREDGRILMAGGARGAFLVEELRPHGVLNRGGFGPDARSGQNFRNDDDVAWGLALLADGGVVVGGVVGGAQEELGVDRLDAGGSANSTWVGLNNVIITDLTPGDDGIADVAVQPDGKVVVAGYAAGASALFVARYLP